MNYEEQRSRCDDNNIGTLRETYPDGLHFVVGDVHGEAETLKALLEKIRFDPSKDHVYFVGDYNAGGYPTMLLSYIAGHYQADYDVPGFHLIRGNHERELCPEYPLANLPDIIVWRGRQLNYCLSHAGMVSEALRLIADDIRRDDRITHAYRLDESCAGYDAPLRQIVWSRRGLYSQRGQFHVWPSESQLSDARFCIIHGHTPYCFMKYGGSHYYYGDRCLFWENQRVLFSEDLQSFDIDSNIKGHFQNGECYRGLSCLCLEVLEETAAACGGRVTLDGIRRSRNGVFSVGYVPLDYSAAFTRDMSRILEAAPDMKTIKLADNGAPVIDDN